MPITVISSIELRRLFQTDTEFAVIDTREAGDFSKGHLLCASNLPLSHLPLLIDRAMPNKNTLIVITNSADDGADRSMATLRELGYKNLHRLSGGIAGWKQSGGEIFSGVNVPGKAFGEFIEHQNSTPSITAEQLAKLLQSDKKVHLLDSRTPEEHVAYCIPGATGCPGGELVLRAGEIFADSDEDAIAVVHCAGRTRSIIGAQTLINAGAVMPVYALENGTLAWQFAHLDLQINNTHHLQQPNQQELQKARVRAHALVQGLDIGEISFDELLAVKPEQTCYRFDIRSAAEFQQGHLKDFRHVAGGQL
ncbi:MAG: rhodanese-related sulfurtransferase, partial [Gammaproteobacteria bacterium]